MLLHGQVTDAGVRALSEKCKSLSTVYLSRTEVRACRNLSVRFVVNMFLSALPCRATALHSLAVLILAMVALEVL